MRYIFLVIVIFSAYAQAESLKVLTLNTWLLEIYGVNLATDIDARREIIADEVLKRDNDIVSLQEVWAPKHAQFLASHLRAKYPYCIYHVPRPSVPVGPHPAPIMPNQEMNLGNGLMIFSKYPLDVGSPSKFGCHEPKNILRFSKATRLDENLVSKGAMHTVIQFNDHRIDFVTTHMGAITYDLKTKLYSASEIKRALQQTKELITFIKKSSKTDNFILAGDLNQNPDIRDQSASATGMTEQYQTLMQQLAWTDSFRISHDLEVEDFKNFASYDTQRNSNAGAGFFSQYPPELIDYVFIKSRFNNMSVLKSQFVLDQPVLASTGQEIYPSDHYALEVDLNLKPL